MHFKQPGFNYSASGLFTKNKERIQKFMQTGNTNYIHKNDLDKACFQRDMACGKYKDLADRTESDKVLKDKALILKLLKLLVIQKMMDIKNDWLQWFTSFFDKKSKCSDIKSMLNRQLTDELYKPIIRKFKRRRAYSSFKEDIWGADLADMQLISKHNKGIRFLLCVVDLFSKYAWVVPLKFKKDITIINAFQSILDNSKRKPNKVWVDQGSEFYNKSYKMIRRQWHKMYSTYKKGKFLVAQRFIRSLKNEIYKHMAVVSENV